MVQKCSFEGFLPSATTLMMTDELSCSCLWLGLGQRTIIARGSREGINVLLSSWYFGFSRAHIHSTATATSAYSTEILLPNLINTDQRINNDLHITNQRRAIYRSTSNHSGARISSLDHINDVGRRTWPHRLPTSLRRSRKSGRRNEDPRPHANCDLHRSIEPRRNGPRCPNPI